MLIIITSMRLITRLPRKDFSVQAQKTEDGASFH